VPTHPTPGRSLVTRRAILDIVHAAALGSYGVTGLAANPVQRALASVGLARPGVRLDLHRGIQLDLDLTVAYGLPIAEVARQVDSAVRYAIKRAVGRDIDRLTIHVNGLAVQPGSAPPRQQPREGVASTDLAESGTDVA
jgi:uncharacterized alkaline shock family protein YloU